jgi:hypothetical protein
MAITKTPLQSFRDALEVFLAETGMAPSRLGALACNDPGFVAGIRNGREPRFSTMECIEHFMVAWRAKHGVVDASDPLDTDQPAHAGKEPAA